MGTTFSSDFRKTFTHGINSLIVGKDQYYILEHMVGSEYHQPGEKQEIMLDEVVLGREMDCHVRFDESFMTVSRHHASIVREGNNWRLVQLSQKNTTFLNGKPIQGSWYLQSGDEIQLAVNGPKLIFKIPSETVEFSFSKRLNSFKDQVIRPYQTAFVIVCCVIALMIVGCVTAGVLLKKQNENIQQLESLNEQLQLKVNQQYDELLKTIDLLELTAQRADSAQQEALKAQAEAYKNKVKLLKSQKNLQQVEADMQKLQDEMNNFYWGMLEK